MSESADHIFMDFLSAQHAAAHDLSGQTDLLDITAIERGGLPPEKYVLHFGCKGLVADGPGDVREADRFAIGVYFHPDYLRFVHPQIALTVLEPFNIWHPNINAPFVCLQLEAGAELVDIAFALYELLSCQKLQTGHGLNPMACQWARQNGDRFPVDRRPLKWRADPAHQTALTGGAV